VAVIRRGRRVGGIASPPALRTRRTLSNAFAKLALVVLVSQWAKAGAAKSESAIAKRRFMGVLR
jgi:hypothetical protein